MRVIATAQQFCEEFDGDVWTAVGKEMTTHGRMEERAYHLSTWEEPVSLAEDFANAKTAFEKASRGSTNQYKCASEFLKWWNLARSVGGIISGPGTIHQLRELKNDNKQLSDTIKEMKATMFSKCPKCGFLKEWDSSVV